MGARTTVETVIYDRRLYQIDRRGYLLCEDCLDPGRGGERREIINREREPWLGACDCCGRAPADWTVSRGRGTAVVEHTAFWIF